jgi:hypothetical protein
VFEEGFSQRKQEKTHKISAWLRYYFSFTATLHKQHQKISSYLSRVGKLGKLFINLRFFPHPDYKRKFDHG